MKQQNIPSQRWVIVVLIFLSVIGIGLWWAADSLPWRGAQADADVLSHPRPEIDLKTPETTEIALFALG